MSDLKNEKQILTATPDLQNLSVREVLQKIHQQDIKIKFVGSGQVSKTWPEAGEALNQDRQMTVFLKE